MIKYIEIKNLYNRFDYLINFEYKDVTILTGPNGYGKTTILKIINYISEGNLDNLSTMMFDKIKIGCDDGNTFCIERKNESLFLNEIKIDILLRRNKNNMIIDRSNDSISFSKNKYVYSINNQNNQEYIDIESIEDEITSIKKHNEAVSMLKKLKKSIGKVYLIREQRLLKVETKKSYLINFNNHIKSDDNVVNVINDLPRKFKEIINEVSSNYSTLSNSLDSTYPHRLFSMENGITEEEYHEKIEEMEDRFEKLSRYDLLKMKSISNVIFDEQHSKALKVYFDDFDKKYKVYEEFINKMDLFIGILNNKLKFKQIKVNRRKGIEVVEENSDKKNTIKLNDLSSGEKQEILLFFELIFNTEKNITLLIDEPEISLHVAWQRRFMDDLISVSKHMKFTSIVATHSPQIIGSHWEKQIDLGELYGEL